jgi:hypothetical protein
VKVHGADEEPRPESSDRWRIQAEQMPPFREVVDTTCQVSVYVCCQDESTLGFSPGPKGVKTGKSDRRGCARLFRPMVPDFLHEAPPTDACAAFIKESRMKFVNARKLDRKSGCTLVRTLAPVRFPPAFATARLLRDGAQIPSCHSDFRRLTWVEVCALSALCALRVPQAGYMKVNFVV